MSEFFLHLLLFGRSYDQAQSHELVKELIEQTTTKGGLRVTANIIKKVYETGRKYSADFKETMRIIFDKFLGQWNYRAIPLKN